MIEPKLIPAFQRGFALTSRLVLKNKFEGVFVDNESAFGGDKPWPRAELPGSEIFFYSSHASWFDPFTLAELSVGRGLRVIAPMNAVRFLSYRSMRFTGAFGVEEGDGPRAEATIDRELEAHPETCVWIMPQGVFCPNECPQPAFKTGLSRWSNKFARRRIPVVMHYQFGIATKPYVFVRMGQPVMPTKLSPDADAALLREKLQTEINALLARVHASQSGPRARMEGFTRHL